MKLGEVVVAWALLTVMACLTAGMEAVDRTWPMPSQAATENATVHLQAAVEAIGPVNAGAFLAVAVVHVDDGLPIPPPRRSGRGGPRVGAGRSAKPGMTKEEFQWLEERRGGRKRAHGSSWDALAPDFNARFRWRGAVDPRTKADRGISGKTLAQQHARFAEGIKMQKQSNSAPDEVLQNLSDGAADSGSRIAREPTSGDGGVP